MSERVSRPDVWCARWLTCGVVCGPGFEGGGRAMLCEACNAEPEPVAVQSTEGAK